MPEDILVIEYEPRYTERVRQALSGQPFTVTFARDGGEALQALSSQQPRLIVMSTIIPKTTPAELIRAVRSRPELQKTPILLTVSGYTGSAPAADAQRVGASDLLPKPYSDADFLAKVQQLLGVAASRPLSQPNADHIVRQNAPTEPGQMTSNDIFGDVLEEERTVVTPPRKTSKTTGDVDKMIADTLAGMMPQKKTTMPGLPRPSTTAGPEVKPRTDAGTTAIDKIVQDTLSGLEKTTRMRAAPPVAAPHASVPAATPPPAPQAKLASQPPAARPPAPRPVPETTVQAPPPAAKPSQSVPAPSSNGFDRVPVSQPVLAQLPAPGVEEEEPVDGEKFGQYVLLEKIATGGMAEVWKARMRGVEGFQKTVAIKKILPHLSDNQDFIEMFIDEAKLAAQLTHNNIIHIYDLGKIQSSYYIAMEYVDGWDLKTILKKAQDHDQPMTAELALFVASKIAAALDYAHRRRDFNGNEMGLVHRDVSPQNVLISQEGDIKLCDFGIAKAASKASHTQAGALKGKLQYMSPEQAWGRNIDRRADIFALSTVLFEMLTGRKLFDGENEMSILDQVREARVKPPSGFNEEVTPAIDAIVLKGLAKEPENRYQTAGEMSREIDEVLYTFRPTPTSADLAIFMHRLSAPGVAPAEQDLEDTVIERAQPIATVAAERPAPVVAMPAFAAPAPQPEVVSRAPFQQQIEASKKSKALPIGIAAVVVMALVGGGFFMMRKSAGTPAPTTAKGAAVVPGTVPATSSAAVSGAETAATTPEAPTTTPPAIDAAKVDEEVRKRLEAEKQKLEKLAGGQQPKTAAPPQQVAAAAPRSSAPTPAAPAPRTTTQPVQSAPPPVSETRAPAEAAPTSSSAGESRPIVPPPPPPAETATQAREGDVVTSSEGLTPPHVIRMAPVTYPSIARSQRIEGSVTIGVLVSETGKVLETRILSGVNKPGGLNEAAEQTIRRSSFAPGMKDGVRVKAWASVKVNFKL